MLVAVALLPSASLTVTLASMTWSASSASLLPGTSIEAVEGTALRALDHENDYTVQLDAFRFFDRLTLQGSAGYRLRGDPPGIDLDDVFLASVGGAYLATDNTMLGMYFDYRQSAISGIDDIQELSGFASFRLGRAWRMELYAFTGLTDSSTDFGGGILFSTDLSQLRVSDRQDY